MYYPQPTVSLAATAVVALRPSVRRHSHSHSPRASSLLRSSTPPPWVSARRGRTPVADDLFTVELDAAGLEPEPDSSDDGLPSPWEGAVVYRRDAAVQHLEYASTLERLGLGDLSSPDSRARAADLGLAGGTLDSTGAQPRTPVLVSLDVTRRRGRLRLDGIVRTVITLGCFRCAEPAPQGIFANFSLLLTEDPVEEPDVVDLGTIFEEDDDMAKGSCAMDGDQDIDWDDRLHFPAADREIDISKHIRDMIHLEITLDAVCNPNCKGLCLTCGANLNTSSCTCKPRNVKGLSPLKGVFNKG